jgi:hypothetical protein
MKALIGLAYRDVEQALLDHSTSSNSALYTEMAAIKAYMASFIGAIEQRLIGQIGAIERCFLALEA